MGKKRPKIIAAAVVEHEGKVLLTKEILEDGKEYWIVPGGSVEWGETLEQAVVREIKEETNLDITVERLLDHKEAIFPEYDYHTIIFFYLVHPLHLEMTLEGKVKDGKFFSLDELPAIQLVESAKWILEQHFPEIPANLISWP
jgi:8-oxo-dGTP diphosphatase